MEGCRIMAHSLFSRKSEVRIELAGLDKAAIDLVSRCQELAIWGVAPYSCS